MAVSHRPLKHRLRFLFLLLVGLTVLFPISSLALTFDLFNNWTISSNDVFLTNRFGILWKDLELPNVEQVEIEYIAEFKTPELNGASLPYLVIPSSWMPYQISLNGIVIADQGFSDQRISKIFSAQLIAIPKNQFQPTNTLLIKSIGSPLLGGFRSDNIVITDETTILQNEKIKTFFLNDIHILFFIISLALSVFGFMVHIKLKNVSFKYLYLGIASAAILPYHLLTTNFYSFFKLPLTAPFRIQLFFQVISWVFWGIFFLSNQKTQMNENYFRRLSYSVPFLIYVMFVGFAAFYFDFSLYSKIITPLFLVPAFLCTYWLLNLAQERKGLFFLAIAAVLTAHISLVSEILNLNAYLIGLSTTLQSIIGGLLFLTEYFGTAEQNRSSSEFLGQLLPIPIKEEVHNLIQKGAPKENIVTSLRGDGTLTNIFVDICSFGKLTRELSSKTVYETRLYVFNFISEILIQKDIHFIKPVGDSMHFCGGILIHTRPSQTRISTACIYGVRDILDAIDTMNQNLKEKNLPEVKLKVSATIGHCEYGFEGTSSNLRFDVQGHWVNITKRFEDHMDRNFYDTYGQNVALISENLFKFSENLSLRKRFLTTFKVTDKDGKVYEALVGQQYPEAVTDQEMMKAIFGQFSHQNRTRTTPNVA